MSQDFIIQIIGKNRYDLPNCTIEGNCIKSWTKYKKFMFLTENDCKVLYDNIKKQFKSTATEQNTKQGLCLSLNKPVDSVALNNMLREFVNKHKMCSVCGVPEIMDGICSACGNCKNNTNIEAKTTESASDKKLSKQEKRALKVAKEKELVQSRLISDDIEIVSRVSSDTDS
jgi:hypothetical protein